MYDNYLPVDEVRQSNLEKVGKVFLGGWEEDGLAKVMCDVTGCILRKFNKDKPCLQTYGIHNEFL
jgi:hypothetical protein